ncbi:MAG: hypothetical protein ACREX6_00410 [Casimicrobiaceae bacterium]
MGKGAFVTDVPARLDRLRWSRFHTLLIAALVAFALAVPAERRPLESVAAPLAWREHA